MIAAVLSALLLPSQGALELEGERVASARIEAPSPEAARLSRYLELKPGEPLRTETVRHIVELLHATGEYEDVVVEAERGPAGLDVVFRPVPAPLLNGILVEGDPVLKPRDVRRITRLREREPVWAARLERAARDAALALAEDGYLEARVTAEPHRHLEGTDVVFTVRSGRSVRVRRASLDGVDPALRAALAERVAPKPGQVYRRRRADEAAEDMRRKLVRRGHWRASVEVAESYDPASGSLDLVFKASPGPRMIVEFRGSALPEDGIRRRVERLVRDGGVKSDALEEAAERIEEAFRRLGHRGVVVSHSEEIRPEGEAVIYTVAGGPQARAQSVRLAIEAEEGLEALVATRAGAPLEESAIARDVRALTQALEERGYAEARVEAEVPEGGGLLPVVFRVHTGPRIRVASVSIESPVSPPEGEPRELRLRVGAPYRVRDLASDRSTLLSAYRDGGYPQVEVTPEVFSEDRSEARIVLRVTPGPRVAVDHVVIAGLEKTREEVVRRELLLKEGQPLGLQRVLESQRRLGALGVFQRVGIAEMDPESEERRSVVVVAEEAPLTTVAYGIGYAERDRLRGSVEVTRRNLFGMDRSLSSFARVSFTGSRLLATYREPYLFGRKRELFVSGFREEEDRPFFDFVRFGGLVQTAFSLSADWRLILRYTYQQTNTFNIVSPGQVSREFAASTLSGPSASVVGDTRDDPLDPRRGHFLSADILVSHVRLGGNSFVKGFLQASTYQRVNARTLIALSGRVGLARTFGLDESIFLSEADRFYAGGDYSLRGFPLDAVNPLGGNGLLLAGGELRVDAGKSLSAAVFSEAGNVYPLLSDMSLRDLRYTAGLGLRYRSAFGPLRIDWGVKLNRRPGESPSHIHFTVGHAF